MVLDGSDDKWYDRRDDKFIDLLDPKLGYYSQLHIPIVKAKIADKDSVLTFDTVSEGHIQVPGGEDIDLGPTSIVDGLYVGKLEDMSPEVFAMHFKRKTCARNASAEFLAIASRHLWPYYRVERNARRLLRSLLNPEQRRVYNDFGFFFVHKDDRIYKVHGYMGVQLVESKHVITSMVSGQSMNRAYSNITVSIMSMMICHKRTCSSHRRCFLMVQRTTS